MHASRTTATVAFYDGKVEFSAKPYDVHSAAPRDRAVIGWLPLYDGNLEFSAEPYDVRSATPYDRKSVANTEPRLRNVATLFEAVRDRVKTVDLKQVNRVLLQPHWRRDADVPQ